MPFEKCDNVGIERRNGRGSGISEGTDKVPGLRLRNPPLLRCPDSLEVPRQGIQRNAIVSRLMSNKLANYLVSVVSVYVSCKRKKVREWSGT
jgi:hypothetical protein